MYKIHTIDYYEWDAFLRINGEDFYFQFSLGDDWRTTRQVTLADAIQFFKYDGHPISDAALASLTAAGLYSEETINA